LFDVGADICLPISKNEGKCLRISAQQVERLEHLIDKMNLDLSPLKSFVIPGGSPATAHLHVARTIVRRAERIIAELIDQEYLNEQLLRYLNRLSDYLFVLGRILNDKETIEALWQPGEFQ
jgi:cob(I)alamin adenosyltransferase